MHHKLRNPLLFAIASSFVLFLVLVGLMWQSTTVYAAQTAVSPHLVSDIDTTTLSSFPYRFVVSSETMFFVTNEPEGSKLWKTDGTPEGTVFLLTHPSRYVFNDLTVVNDKVYFMSRNGLVKQLWVSDGTMGGTIVVKDMSTHASFDRFTAVGDTLFFVTHNSVYGTELWKSDGTEVGTMMVKDINVGPDSSFAHNLIEINGELYFSASDSINGNALWKSDGTEAGTVMVADLDISISDITDMNGTVFIYGSGELWQSDGTEAGTELVRDIGLYSSAAGFIGIIDGGWLIFEANDGIHGDELWKSDGTFTNTVMIKDVVPGDSDFYMRFSSVELNGEIYFVANDHVHGYELWKTDGSADGTLMVSDIASGEAGATPRNLVVYNDNLLFSANDETGDGDELWITDGTTVGTTLLKDVYPYGFSSQPQDLTVFDNRVFFSAHGAQTGRELWVTDGTETGTTVFLDIVSDRTESSKPNSFTHIDDTLIFIAQDEAGPALWASEGLEENTTKLQDISAEYNAIPFATATPSFSDNDMGNAIAQLNNEVYFAAEESGDGVELWKTDGTEAGTILLADVNITPEAGSNPSQLTKHQNEVYFRADDGTHGNELWVTDGTEEGTRLVKDIFDGTLPSFPQDLTSFGDLLFFSAETFNGREPWVTDGTEEGTFELQDILSGGDSSISDYGTTTAVMNNVVYFITNEYVTYQNLWRSDGTTDGTYLFYELNQFSVEELAVVENNLYFVAHTSDGNELWKTDGTEAGTMIVKDIASGPASSFPRTLTPVGNRLYFVALDALWVTDGTEAGTYQVSEVAISLNNAYGTTTRVGFNDILFFQADDGVHGAELWQSDGTPEGTFMVMDINIGLADSNPNHFYVLENSLYFVANDGEHDEELWVWQNGVPVLVADDVATDMNTATQIMPLDNDADPDGHDLTLVSYTEAQHGILTLNGSVFTYTPTMYYLGTDTFTYIVRDTYGTTATGNVTINVTGNALPEANADEVTTWMNTPLTLFPLTNDNDPNNDELTLVSVTTPDHGTVMIDGETIIYTPADYYIGVDTFEYTIEDGRGGEATGTVSVFINTYQLYLPYVQR